MSDAFRELLRTIGSGPHTGKNLSREQAAAATRMMLQQEATPAQIGAFMIAHRIKRPTGEELAGMLDAYDQLGPKLQVIDSPQPVIVFGCPYDGRDRTAPLSVLTALILATAGCAVILHGGERMPTKEGVPLVELWQSLGVDWTQLSLGQVQDSLQTTGIGFVYLPNHFPLAQGLVPYREQIGKRPPFSTLELFWSPYAGDAHVIMGFVHPPTEIMARQAFALRGTQQFTTVKGLEGSFDLPRERTAIIGCSAISSSDWKPLKLANSEANLESTLSEPIPLELSSAHQHPDLGQFVRLHLHPQDYGFAGKNVPLLETDQMGQLMLSVMQGESSELKYSAIWNGGFYLWRCGICPDLSEAIAKAKALLDGGALLDKLKQLQNTTALSTQYR
jgi:anthranilate phosphoribosyltransferase